jgi:hypothetical protein
LRVGTASYLVSAPCLGINQANPFTVTNLNS